MWTNLSMKRMAIVSIESKSSIRECWSSKASYFLLKFISVERDIIFLIMTGLWDHFTVTMPTKSRFADNDSHLIYYFIQLKRITSLGEML